MTMQRAEILEPPPVRSRDIRSVLEWGSASLSGRGFDESRLHAELLLAHALGVPRNRLTLLYDRILSQNEVGQFFGLLTRRLTHEPLQYIVGETEFMGLRIEVDARVLIPRPETELLVERALDCIRSMGSGTVRVLDIGTGSGCVAVALATMAPGCSVTATDVDVGALEVAGRNVHGHGLLNVSVRQSDIFSDDLAGQMFECIVANPPYVPVGEYAGLQREVREFEPRAAVTDGGDGLRFARRIAGVAAAHLVPHGCVLVETGAGTAEEVKALFRNARLVDATAFEDYAHIPRVISARQAHTGRTA